MNQLHWNEQSAQMLEQLSKGAFLTVQDEQGSVNTMTISWGSVGYMWGRPVVTVMVRRSRHTYQLIEQSDAFTISLPLKGQLKEELGICGSQSGRNINKFDKCSLKILKGQQVDTPVIADCNMFLECKIVCKQDLALEQLRDDITKQWYESNDYHVLYYGEIVAYYNKE